MCKVPVMICGKTNLALRDGAHFFLPGITPVWLVGDLAYHPITPHGALPCLLLFNMHTDELEGDSDGPAGQMGGLHKAERKPGAWCQSQDPKGAYESGVTYRGCWQVFYLACHHPGNKY